MKVHSAIRIEKLIDVWRLKVLLQWRSFGNQQLQCLIVDLVAPIQVQLSQVERVGILRYLVESVSRNVWTELEWENPQLARFLEEVTEIVLKILLLVEDLQLPPLTWAQGALFEIFAHLSHLEFLFLLKEREHQKQKVGGHAQNIYCIAFRLVNNPNPIKKLNLTEVTISKL